MGLTLCVGLLLLALVPGHALAQFQEGIAHEYTYGQTARFTAALPVGVTVTAARLFLRIPRASLSETKIYEATMDAGMAMHERDLRLNPFPPFAALTYWWTFLDAGGVTHTTEPVNFLYEDNRFAWQELRDGAFTIRWIAGSSERMVTALNIAHAATAEITSRLRAADPGAVSFYIYPSTADLQAALRLTSYEWLAGMSLPEVGVVLLAIPPTDAGTIQMQSDIPHELTHQILYRHLGDAGYGALPIWLVEGLAATFEQRVDATRLAPLAQAQQEGTLLPLAELCAPFYSLDTQQLWLAYAESRSVVTYLLGTYGWSSVRGLLETYADGRDCSAGMKHALGVDLPTFERQWRAWLDQGGQFTSGGQQRWVTARLVLRDLAPWLMLAGLLMLPGVMVWFHRRDASLVSPR